MTTIEPTKRDVKVVGENEQLAAGLAYAAHGWPVHPLNGKVPLVQDWPNGATTDLDRITTWWTKMPTANVGIVTGPRSGLVVLDVDVRSDGYASLCRLERKLGPFRDVPMSCTPTGGIHLLFAHPGTPVKSRGQAFGPDMPGLDVKADGGQIVAPPSAHPEPNLDDFPEGRYAWHPSIPWQGPLSPWPAVLTRLMDPPKPPPRAGTRRAGPANPARRLDALLKVVADRTPGDRNFRLHWAACRAGEMVAEGEIGTADAVTALQDAGQAAGLADSEIGDATKGTIGSGLRKGRSA